MGGRPGVIVIGAGMAGLTAHQRSDRKGESE